MISESPEAAARRWQIVAEQYHAVLTTERRRVAELERVLRQTLTDPYLRREDVKAIRRVLKKSGVA